MLKKVKLRAGSKKMGKKEEYFPKLKAEIEEFGEWEVNINHLSKKWGIPNQSLYRWKDQIVEELGTLDINEFGRNIQLTGISNIKLCQRLIRKANPIRDKLLGIKIFNETVKSYTDFLEAYGYKKKVADKLETSGSLSWQDFNKAYDTIYNKRKIKKVR